MTIDDYVRKNQQQFINLLANFVSQKSLSQTGEGIQATVKFLKELLEQFIHAKVEIIETAGNPIIIATLSPGKDNEYLFYGHYDVQLPGKLVEWKVKPFKLTQRDGRLYGRGTGDNKGQLIAQICGFYVYQQLYGELPFTARILIEGEEEIGSPHLIQTVRTLKDPYLNNLSAVFVMDGSISQSGDHVLRLGNRGVLSFRLGVRTNGSDLHSGNFGNVSKNAAVELMRVLNKLINPLTGQCRIKEFYKGVVEPSSQEREWLNALPSPDNIPAPIYKNKFDYYYRLMFQPSMTINGLSSGYEGNGVKTIIPGKATAIVDCRLVADQTCDEAVKLINDTLKAELDEKQIQIKYLVKLDPVKIEASNPLIPRLVSTITEATGKALIEPVMPGSVPNYIWRDIVGIPPFTIPLANYDQHNHAPNENITIDAFLDGIKIIAYLCRNLNSK
ncbi:M20/M25/M40 family metallo-hydrolase [Limosilactobacillus agrestimuris]|uniref:M20/M25/M40 family metallo-hydrolase n=1 Tax=Limosilactobacillus agrestimuris TaxID=2941331 RepID=UPI002042448D|nr:M20/M25/M40 family metallo-hydrolase [Limosilactobacillus agrestimuris]